MAAETVVRVEDLTIGWRDALLLEHASFAVRRGDVFAILGRSGSGKSTLLKHLLGLERPLSGNIWVLGRTPQQLRRGPPPYGATFQSGALLGSLTVGENVALPLERWTRLRGTVVDQLVAAKLHVVGLDAAGSKTPAELSGGMRTRAAIARAMVLEPSLLFLDEPSAGLDPVTAVEFDKLVLLLNRTLGLTVVVVTHHLDSIFRIATRCVMLDRDSRSIIAAGDPRELRDGSRDQRVRRFLNPSAEEAT